MSADHSLRGTLADRTVLITGVSGGIGSALVEVFGREGAFLVGTYRSRESEAREALEAATPERHALVHADVTSAATARALWREAADAHPIDTVVINAAVMMRTPLSGDDEAWDDGWETSLNVNVIAAATLMREAANDLAQRGGGSIVVISSWAAEARRRASVRGVSVRSHVWPRSEATSLRTSQPASTISPGVVARDHRCRVIDDSFAEHQAVQPWCLILAYDLRSLSSGG